MDDALPSAPSRGAFERPLLITAVVIGAFLGITIFLAFFSGASERALDESRRYWALASPISVLGVSDAYGLPEGGSAVYFLVKNNGQYPITITRILSDSGPALQFSSDTSGRMNMLSARLEPGQTACFGNMAVTKPSCPERQIVFSSSPGKGQNFLPASKLCGRNGNEFLEVSGFGFEYVQDVFGVQSTRQMAGGAPFRARCSG